MDISSFLIDAAPTQWRTSAFSGEINVPHGEIAGLKNHLDRCNAERGPLFGLRCAGESLNSALRGRFITLMTFAALVIAASAVVF